MNKTINTKVGQINNSLKLKARSLKRRSISRFQLLIIYIHKIIMINKNKKGRPACQSMSGEHTNDTDMLLYSEKSASLSARHMAGRPARNASPARSRHSVSGERSDAGRGETNYGHPTAIVLRKIAGMGVVK